jgi:hypothetical protein
MTIDYKHGGDKEKRKIARQLAKEQARLEREQFSEAIKERKPISPATMSLLSAAFALGYNQPQGRHNGKPL